MNPFGPGSPLTTHLSLPCTFRVVCIDGSCDGSEACKDATIPYVVGPSCTGFNVCREAQIGSVDSSCTSGPLSCYKAQLSGVALMNSCNNDNSCRSADGKGVISELIDCCNDANQCEDEEVSMVDPACVSLNAT